MNRIDITHAYAHDLMLQALDICIAGYPVAAELKPVESIGLGCFMLEDHKIYYDPDELMNITFNELVDSIHAIFITYYLKKLPMCSLQPIFNPLQH